MDDIRECDTHGYFARETCPDCDRVGTLILSQKRRRRLSKYLSGALRHFPDDAGIELDSRGWTDAYDAVEAVKGKYSWADAETIAAVVSTTLKDVLRSMETSFEQHTVTLSKLR